MLRDGVVHEATILWRREPVDPATVTTVAEQRAEIDRLYEEIQRGSRND